MREKPRLILPDAYKKIVPILEMALKFLLMGIAIVPLKPRSKQPYPGYSSRKFITEESELRAFFDRHPDANYGLVTGPPSKLVVLDVDGKVGIESLKRLRMEVSDFPMTPTVKTADGYHRYFRDEDGFFHNSTSKLGPGLDIRGDGGYAVGPESIHPSGQRYMFFKGRTMEAVALPPSTWLRDAFATRAAPVEKANGLIPSEISVVEGGRNDALTQYLGLHVRNGMKEGELLLLANAENGKYHPPLDTQEVIRIVQSVMRYSPVDRDADPGEAYASLVLETEFAGGKHLLHAANGSFWQFDGKKWCILPPAALKQKIYEVYKRSNDRARVPTVSLLKQVSELLVAMTTVAGDPLRFNSPPLSALNLRNGELWLNSDGTVELKPHQAASYLRHYLDIDYDPKATSPLFDKTLEEMFPAETADVISYLHEVFAYVLQPRRPIALVMIWKGFGSNGKSALAGLLAHMLGTEAVASMSVKNLGHNQFSMNALFGRLLFLDDDVPTGTRLPDGELKKISEEKLLSAEKKFGDPYNFLNRAFPLLLCNNPPTIIDLSEGMRRRLQVVPFTVNFKDAQQDRTLFDRIKQTELSGVLNHAISGYGRLVRAGWRLSTPIAVKRATERFLMEANPIPAFLDETTEAGSSVLVAHLYSRYETWCREQGITMAQQRQSFQRNVESCGYKAVKRNKGMVFLGLSLSV